jgi:hypothetical protein
MAINYNTYYSMPRLHDYAEASKWEQDVKPIRGDDEKRKPLGRRNQKYRHIKREEDGSIAIYDCWRRWTLRYTPDGELHIYDVGYWNKSTQNEVIERVTGLICFTEAGRAWINYDGGTAPIPQRVKPKWNSDLCKYEDVPPGADPAPAIFVKNERGKWEHKNPVSIMTHVVSRKGAKAVRQRYATGISYVTALALLRGVEQPKHEEIIAAFKDTRLSGVSDEDTKYWWSTRNRIPPVTDRYFKHEHAADVAALIASEDPTDQYRAYLWLSRDGNEQLPKRIDKVLAMHHHDEWFVEREAPVGKKTIDRYEWAFPKQA